MSTLVNPVVGAIIYAADLGSYYNLFKGIGGSGELITTFYKGSDIASASTITPSGGNFFHVTGTVTITAIGAAPAGTVVALEFTGALQLTHNGTSLILQNSTNYTTAAGDVFGFVSEGSGNWRELWRRLATATAAPSFATPAIVLGTAAAAGAASTVIRSDATVVAFDTTVGAAIGTAAAGSAALASKNDHVHPITNSSAVLGSDVTFAANNTWTDVLSLALGIGTWKIEASAHIDQQAQNTVQGLRLQNTTDTASLASGAYAYNTVVGYVGQVPLTTIVVLAGTKTIKLQAITNGNFATMIVRAATSIANGTGNNATQVTAIKIG